ncbi:MAG: endolytic transglycosylase MltG [Acidiferrobacterales bacterium]
MSVLLQNKIIRQSVIGIGGVIAVAIIYLLVTWNTGLDTGDKIYIVKKGDSLKRFATDLYRDGILPNRYSIVWLAYLRGQHRGLKAGEYRFETGISQRQLLDKVVSGDSIKYILLIPEGWNFFELMRKLNDADKIKHTLKDLAPDAIMARLGLAGMHPEGRFFPDTYQYTAGTRDIVILRNAFERMEKHLSRQWQDREPGLPYDTSYKALVMASIIEKETGMPDERPEIAGVFVNRLRMGMRLQTDPTVIYGIGVNFDGNIRRRDLRRDTPYNTYTRKGLPPTPIAMPGAGAIYAALHPAKTKNLYFVSRGNGTHKFSTTFKEHNQAVRKYQLGGKE